ncbi:uncharacterized protein LOC127862243 isoform X1 [Dreissena polymorpha]|uniref:uncharacterized protein LOC127862243 isoform X1 n=1 Tax=Dreissena polymorpha TaxID=45954 RepID=UPI0022640C25|nr:uncharacterized protein LOC127862243 isoform X1 [Dreissena polymorpha]XP_052257245.1 uncharacterized protein LOC127862243 isoform X1 [Dreissena polymorpha]
MSPADPQKPEFQVWIIAAVIQASIAFNNHAVPVPLTTTCTDGNTAITGTFSVNIVDEPPVISALPASGTAINDGLQTTAAILSTFSVTDSDDAVTCSVRVPQNARFEVVAATSPELSKIPMPVVFNEPITFLQRITEYLEYSTLLELAAKQDDPVDRLQRSRFGTRDARQRP